MEGETPERRPGRRPAMYFYRDYPAKWNDFVSVFTKKAVLKGSFGKYAVTDRKRGNYT
jgi:hypothetical protein